MIKTMIYKKVKLIRPVFKKCGYNDLYMCLKQVEIVYGFDDNGTLFDQAYG